MKPDQARSLKVGDRLHRARDLDQIAVVVGIVSDGSTEALGVDLVWEAWPNLPPERVAYDAAGEFWKDCRPPGEDTLQILEKLFR